MRQKCTFTGEVGRCRDIQPQKPEVRVTKAKPGKSVEQTLGAACTQQGHSEHLVYYGARGQETLLSHNQLTCSISVLRERPSSDVPSHITRL